MLTFSGKKFAVDKSTFYRLKVNGHAVPLCYGTLYAAVGAVPVTQETKNQHTWAWGYEGDDPGITAVTLLGCCIGLKCNFWGCERLSPLAVISHFTEDYNKHISRLYPSLDYVGLWPQFMAHVVANLPDEWSMNSDEIEKWMLTFELPQCITNQQPKET